MLTTLFCLTEHHSSEKRLKDIPVEAIEIASVNLSPQLINVNVIGEIESPGTLQLKANTPLCRQFWLQVDQKLGERM